MLLSERKKQIKLYLYNLISNFPHVLSLEYILIDKITVSTVSMFDQVYCLYKGVLLSLSNGDSEKN